MHTEGLMPCVPIIVSETETRAPMAALIYMDPDMDK